MMGFDYNEVLVGRRALHVHGHVAGELIDHYR